MPCELQWIFLLSSIKRCIRRNNTPELVFRISCCTMGGRGRKEKRSRHSAATSGQGGGGLDTWPNFARFSKSPPPPPYFLQKLIAAAIAVVLHTEKLPTFEGIWSKLKTHKHESERNCEKNRHIGWSETL